MLGSMLTHTITPQSKAADGTFADIGAGIVMKGRWEESSEGLSLETDPISPADCFYANPVPFEQSFEYNLIEFPDAALAVYNSIASNSALDQAIRSSFYAKIKTESWDRDYRAGSAAVKRTMIVIALLTNFNPNYRKGGARASVKAEAVALPTGTPGVYSPNPAFS
jgi:hypothetical protein